MYWFTNKIKWPHPYPPKPPPNPTLTHLNIHQIDFLAIFIRFGQFRLISASVDKN